MSTSSQITYKHADKLSNYLECYLCLDPKHLSKYTSTEQSAPAPAQIKASIVSLAEVPVKHALGFRALKQTALNQALKETCRQAGRQASRQAGKEQFSGSFPGRQAGKKQFSGSFPVAFCSHVRSQVARACVGCQASAAKITKALLKNC